MLKKLGKLGISWPLLAGLVVLSGGLMNSAQALPLESISEVYFFGDSLTDSGFNDYYPSATAGKAPTFTTYQGYVWSQYLAHDIKGYMLPSPTQYPYSPTSPPYHPDDTITNNTTPVNHALCPGGVCPVSGLLTGIDYACGGSTTNSTGNGLPWAPSLYTQVQYFLLGHSKLDPKALYFVWAGANDVLVAYQSTTNPADLELALLRAANTAASNVAKEVALLSDHGARRIVIMNLPNIGLTPLIHDLIIDGVVPPSVAGSMQTASFTFNSMLNQQLGKVIASHSATKILYVDVYNIQNNIIRAINAGKPYVVGNESFWFTNYTTPICGYTIPPAPGVIPAYISAINCANSATGYVFADDIHPSDEAHRLVALSVEQQIKAWG